MRNWNDIGYLLDGNKVHESAYEAIKTLGILERLEDYNATLVGTLPIAIDIAGSDLDIICEVYDFEGFEAEIMTHYAKHEHFKIKRLQKAEGLVIVANFEFMAFEFELYAASQAIEAFIGYRHMLIEHRILELLGAKFCQEVITLKRAGIKTEPAFAQLLGITGDPYQGMLDIDKVSDDEIINLY